MLEDLVADVFHMPRFEPILWQDIKRLIVTKSIDYIYRDIYKKIMKPIRTDLDWRKYKARDRCNGKKTFWDALNVSFHPSHATLPILSVQSSKQETLSKTTSRQIMSLNQKLSLQATTVSHTTQSHEKLTRDFISRTSQKFSSKNICHPWRGTKATNIDEALR